MNILASWNTPEELLALVRQRKVGIACQTAEERVACIETLLAYGFEHGTSGVSKRILRGGHIGEWMYIFSRSGRIEFYNYPDPDYKWILATDFLGCMGESSLDVDDLL